ncbi:hypothetical protein [Hyalangium sp.]|uniref:hypothetical protein n=1 Tax=Hyalangium sp. TaxID=2028555 RepID=UPI002D337C22|nr:hypothetical protein [Hyalangium sp.]HYH99532.1 hypothetical protein [Hyalangium sp.]
MYDFNEGGVDPPRGASAGKPLDGQRRSGILGEWVHWLVGIDSRSCRWSSPGRCPAFVTLRRLLGEAWARRLAEAVQRHSAGVGGSVILGVLLAVAPGVGHFFGLPLDVRHVTLAFGSLVFAACSLGPGA